jgi:hypothetical protein
MDCENLLVLVGALTPLLSSVWCSDFEGDASTVLAAKSVYESTYLF